MLDVQHLCIHRGDRPLVSALSLHLHAGELLHLRGANGCGKTSVLEALAGLRRPHEGTISSGVDALPRHWIGHRNGLTLALSALENLNFWCGINGVDSALVPAALTRMALPRSAWRRPLRGLSAGQKRRSAMARLLLQARPLWLLDEPLDGLDVDGIALAASLLDAQVRGGGSVIITSHQPLPEGLPSVRTLDVAAFGAPP